MGEDIEKVREDFVRDFQDVDPAEIMKAEQGLMESGMPLSKVQKLCDVHSALFHGESEEEKIENAEKAVQASLKKGKIISMRARRPISLCKRLDIHSILLPWKIRP